MANRLQFRAAMLFHRLKSIFVWTLMMSASHAAYARFGPGEGGGGDPDAQQFVTYGRKLAAYFRENPLNLELPFSAKDFAVKVDALDASLKDESRAPLIQLTSDALDDQNQASKDALFDRDKGSVKASRPYWLAATDEKKLILDTMEIAGLLGVPLRYESAEALVGHQTPLILSMALPNAREKTPIDWHIANQDSDIFARLTDHDVVIDGGILGVGDEANRRADRFLENPLADAEWMALAQKAFALKMPAYFVLRDRADRRASVTAFREATTAEGKHPSGVATYTLLLYAKSRPVGRCSHEAALTPLDRLQNCFFDRRFYQLFDAQSGAASRAGDEAARAAAWRDAFSGVRESLIAHYADEPDALANALSAAFIQDYSSVLPSQYRTFVLRASARAHGLMPTFLRGDVAFWERRGEANADSIRFFAALKAMADARVGLDPGPAPQCVIQRNGGLIIPSGRAASVVSLEELRQITDREGSCFSRDLQYLAPALYRALAQSGFVYSPGAQAWSRGPARRAPGELMTGQFLIGREIETRFVAENGDASSFLRDYRATVARSSVTERLGAYHDVLPHWRFFGLSREQAEALYRDALDDISQNSATVEKNPASAPADLAWSITSVYPLNKFIGASVDLALTDDFVSPALSKEFVGRTLAAPWLNRAIAYKILDRVVPMRGARDQKSPYRRLAIAEIMRRTFFDAGMASHLARSLVEPYYGPFADRGKGPLVSYVDLNEIGQAVAKANLLKPEESDALAIHLKMFKRGAEFERRSAAENSGADEQAHLLARWLRTPNDAYELSDLVARFLIVARPSDQAKAELLAALMSASEGVEPERLMVNGLSEMSGLAPMFAMIPFLTELPRASQDAVLEFVAVKLKDRGKHGKWAREVLPIRFFDHRDWLVKRIPGAQRALERIAETSDETKNVDSFRAPEDPEWRGTEADRLITHLQICTERQRAETVCDDLPSPRAILEKIAADVKLPAGLRDRARAAMANAK